MNYEFGESPGKNEFHNYESPIYQNPFFVGCETLNHNGTERDIDWASPVPSNST